MARHVGGVPKAQDAETLEAASKLADWAKPKGAKKRSSGIGEAAFVRCLEEAGEMLRLGRWEQATGKHFVALYSYLHFRVYEVEPLDLGSKERVYAAKMANDMIKNDFGGSREEMARFLAWTWTREKGQEAWRRANGRKGGRIGWAFQFGRKLLTDYKIDGKRSNATEGARG